MPFIPMSYRGSLFFHGLALVAVSLTQALNSLIAAPVSPTKQIYNTRQETTPLLTPEETLATFHLPAGFHASVFASEPDVQQPIGMTLDRRGRLWVAENYTYAQQPLGWDTNLSDRIIILEDTNHDGHFDKRTVFYDRAEKLTSVAIGFGGVYALCPPRLLFFPDRDGDDVPDGEPEVLLDGFEDTVVWHNIANGLKWGPDGWLYGRHGIQGISHVGAPGSPLEKRTALNAGIWRFHPVTHKFEVVAEGTTNPWGTDWDANGQLFFINTVIGHLWHVVPGAYYKRMYGEHARPHLYELIDQTADHFHWDTLETWDRIRSIGVSSTTSQAGGGHAHSGLMIYLGDNWPDQYRGTVFAINFHGKRLNNDKIERQGATYTAHHAPDLISVGDPWFRGIDLLYGPAGAVFISDWSDIGECHDADGIHRTSGRIYKVWYGDPPKGWSGDVAKLSNDELVKLQLHRNEWLAREARQVLQERAVNGDDMTAVHTALRKLLADQHEVSRQLAALWALYVTGGGQEPWLLELLRHPDEQVRVWAIQLLVDQGTPSLAALNEFARMAAGDKSGLVLTFLASAMRRAAPSDRWPIVTALSRRGEFADDRVFPLMLWYGIEPAVAGDVRQAVALARETRIPKLTRFIGRRIFEEAPGSASGADHMTGTLKESPDAKFQIEVLTGITEALNGTRKPVAPRSWALAGPALMATANEQVRDLARELSARFGDPAAIDSLRQLLADTQAAVDARRNALQTLLQTRAEGLSPMLFPLLNEINLAPDAIRALAALGEPKTTEVLLQRYPTFKEEQTRSEVVNALASRLLSALAMLEAVQHGQIPRQAIDPTQIRQMRSLKNAQVDEKINAIWPQLDESASGKKQIFAHYRQLLSPARLQSSNPSEGRRVFQQTCALCHALFGEGAKIGPDITGSDRRNLDYLLENILNPSAVVPYDYRVWVVTTKADRVLNGIILAQNAQSVTLQTVSEKVSLPRNEIESMSQSQLSMMPEGLLQALTDEQVANLIAYLMSPGQVPLPAGGEGK
jgi:putative membrane-bound dehydrogenase-like protein